MQVLVDLHCRELKRWPAFVVTLHPAVFGQQVTNFKLGQIQQIAERVFILGPIQSPEGCSTIVPAPGKIGRYQRLLQRLEKCRSFIFGEFIFGRHFPITYAIINLNPHIDDSRVRSTRQQQFEVESPLLCARVMAFHAS